MWMLEIDGQPFFRFFIYCCCNLYCSLELRVFYSCTMSVLLLTLSLLPSIFFFVIILRLPRLFGSLDLLSPTIGTLSANLLVLVG